MILATHNSLSYLKPQWWLRPFAWVGRCQSLTIEQQLEYGVRYFDIRVRVRGQKLMSGHGLLTYNVNLLKILETIEQRVGVVVRLTLEDTKATKEQQQTFINFCIMCELRYEKIFFVGGYQKGTWEHIYEFDHSSGDITECYWTYSKKRWFPFPKLYAWLNNKRYKTIETEGYLMLDYVQL